MVNTLPALPTDGQQALVRFRPSVVHMRLRPDDRRAQLLGLAVRMFTARPYDDFSMDELATAAGVSKGLLYHYFPSKRALYLEVLRVAASELLDLTQPQPGLPPAQQLRAALTAYLAYVRQRADAYRAMLRGGIGNDPEVAEVAEDVRRAFRERILDGLGIPQPSPRLRTTITGWVGLVETASLDWLEHGDLDRERLVELLVDGLAALLAALQRSSSRRQTR
jgi:AcrR family transcriptional regulator